VVYKWNLDGKSDDMLMMWKLGVRTCDIMTWHPNGSIGGI